MTNADRIRNMTDEELANFIVYNNFDADEENYDYWKNWVKSEFDEDGKIENSTKSY